MYKANEILYQQLTSLKIVPRSNSIFENVVIDPFLVGGAEIGCEASSRLPSPSRLLDCI